MTEESESLMIGESARLGDGRTHLPSRWGAVNIIGQNALGTLHPMSTYPRAQPH